MVVATSESDQQMIIAKHLTAAAAAASASASASFSFRTSTAQISAAAPTISIPDVSAACKASTVSLHSNNAIKAARDSVIESGCTELDTKDCSISGLHGYTCTCIATYSNDAQFRSLVAQSGGQVCSLDMKLTATASDGLTVVDVNYHGGLGMYGSSCTNTDIQAILFYAFNNANFDTSGENKIQSVIATLSMCGTSYTGARQINGSNNNNKPIGIAITALIGIIITIINAVI